MPRSLTSLWLHHSCQNGLFMPDNWKAVRVPASSANLGPGFDSLGLALDVHLECRFRPAAELIIQASGRDTNQIASGSNNFIWQTAVNIAAAAGRQLPPMEL